MRDTHELQSIFYPQTMAAAQLVFGFKSRVYVCGKLKGKAASRSMDYMMLNTTKTYRKTYTQQNVCVHLVKCLVSHITTALTHIHLLLHTHTHSQKHTRIG